MIVRYASADDVEAFEHLWFLFLHEAYDQGSDIVPSWKNVQVFCKLFALYQQNPSLGVCVLAIDEDPIGVGLWGVVTDEPMLETRHAPVANGWGVFVLPEHRRKGVSRAIRSTCVDELLRRGFRSVVGTASLQNKASYDSSESFGFIPTHTQGVLLLDQFRELHLGSMEQGMQE